MTLKLIYIIIWLIEVNLELKFLHERDIVITKREMAGIERAFKPTFFSCNIQVSDICLKKLNPR